MPARMGSLRDSHLAPSAVPPERDLGGPSSPCTHRQARYPEGSVIPPAGGPCRPRHKPRPLAGSCVWAQVIVSSPQAPHVAEIARRLRLVAADIATGAI